MRTFPLIALLSVVSLPVATFAEKPAAYPVTYAGGSLPLDHDKVVASVDGDAVVFTQHNRKISVPLRNITEISFGTEVRRRMGASVLEVVPMMHLGQAESHYIGLTWTGTQGSDSKAQVLLKLSRADHLEFLVALEQKTGIRAVDTTRVPTVVHYNL